MRAKTFGQVNKSAFISLFDEGGGGGRLKWEIKLHQNHHQNFRSTNTDFYSQSDLKQNLKFKTIKRQKTVNNILLDLY